MGKRALLLLSLSLGVVSAAAAAVPTSHFTISFGRKEGKVEYLAVRGGRLVLGPPTKHARDEQDAPERWFILGTKIKSSVGGGYLAYDPTGKDPKVFLTPNQNDKGTDWEVRRPKGAFHQKNQSRSLDEEWGTVRAASGPLKGWFLDAEEAEQKPGPQGKDVPACRFVLRKEPSCNVEAARIYTHK
jgi:hypothetical protein